MCLLSKSKIGYGCTGDTTRCMAVCHAVLVSPIKQARPSGHAIKAVVSGWDHTCSQQKRCLHPCSSGCLQHYQPCPTGVCGSQKDQVGGKLIGSLWLKVMVVHVSGALHQWLITTTLHIASSEQCPADNSHIIVPIEGMCSVLVIGDSQFNAVVTFMQCPHAQPLHGITLTCTADVCTTTNSVTIAPPHLQIS